MNQRVIASGVSPISERIPTSGGVSVVIAGVVGYTEAIFVGPTWVSTVRLPIAIAIPRIIEFDGANLWIAEGINYPSMTARVHRFSVTGAPPSALTLVESTPFGDANTRPDALVLDASGGLTFFYHQQQAVLQNGAWWMQVYTVYRPPAGVWGTPVLTLLYGAGFNSTSSRSSACLHPADGSAWCFWKRDTMPWLDAVRSVGGVPHAFPQIVSQTTDGQNGPDGENVFVIAVPDVGARHILLGYERNDYKFFSTNPFVKGCTIGLAHISSIGEKAFTPFTANYISRLWDFALMPGVGGVTLVFQPLTSATPTGAIVASTLTGGVWSPIVPVDTGTFNAQTSGNWMGYGGSESLACYQRPTGELVILSGAAPAPPVAMLSINSSANGASLSWPAGKTLQQQNASGVFVPVPDGTSSEPIPPSGVVLRVV